MSSFDVLNPVRLSFSCLLVSLLLLFSSCETSVHVSRAFPVGEVGFLPTLKWQFNEALAPADSVGKWTDTDFFKFSPPIQGRFKWETESKLTFAPSEPLQPATEYVASSTDNLTFGNRINLTSSTNEFHTAPFRVTDIRVSWANNRDYYYYRDAPVSLRLDFNYEVDPDQLEKYIEVTLDGVPVSDLNAKSYSSDKELEMVWESRDASEAIQCYQVRLKKGLAPTFERSPLQEDFLAEVSLAPLTDLTITDVRKVSRYNNAIVEVYTSQPVDPRFVKSFVSVKPSVGFSVEKNDQGFSIKGAFDPGKEYALTLDKGCPGLMGGTLKKEWNHTVEMPPLKPFLRFTERQGAYLLRNGWENISVSTAGLPLFTYTLYEIYENNLVHFLNKNSGQFSRYSWYDDEFEYYYDGGDYVSLNNYGREIHSDTVTLPEGKSIQEVHHVPVGLHQKMQSKSRGIFAMEINNPENYYAEDRKVISLSDIGIITKKTNQEILVFVNALSTARPVAGALVKVISETNQTMFTGTTDGMGVVRIRDTDRKAAGFEARLITVTKGQDFNYLDLNKTRIRTGKYNLDGKSPRPGNTDIFVYGDRELYRPGDTAHVVGLLRNWDLTNSANTPLKLSVSGRGRELQATKVVTNRQGAFEMDIPIPASEGTGYYSVSISDGAGRYLTEYDFQVEEFVPDKIKVQIEMPDSVYRAGETVRIPLAANYYFGAPCADHIYKVNITPRVAPFRPEGYSEFLFGPGNDYDRNHSSIELKGTLDSLGNDTIEFQIPPDLFDQDGIVLNTLFIVYDNTSRPVQRFGRVKARYKDHYLGIKGANANISQYSNARFELIGLNGQGNPLIGHPAKVEIRRFDYKRVLHEVNGRIEYKSEKRETLLKEESVTLGAQPVPISLRLEEVGEHEIILRDVAGKAIVQEQFTVMGPSVEASTSFDIDPEGEIIIRQDKESYQTGESARLIFSTPFSGRMLVTIERDKVYQYQYIDVPRTTASLNLPLNMEHVPNVMVSAILFRPQRNGSGLIMTKAQGYTNLKIKAPSREIPVRIEAPDMVRPGTSPVVTVRTQPNRDVYLTLAAVDEGILSIKNFQTPDPFQYFYAARDLLVTTYDLYRFLLPEVAPSGGATGGGGGPGTGSVGGNNANPITAKRFKPMAFWSGLVAAGPDGTARIPVEIPAEFNGNIRLMAVAHSGKSFGSSTSSMISRDDVVMVPALPRFVSAGDSVYAPLNLLNATDKTKQVTVTLTATSPLKVVNGAAQRIEIPPNGSAIVGFNLATDAKIGVANLRYEIKGDENRVQEFEMAVSPPAPMESVAGSGKLKPGDSLVIDIPKGYYPDMQSSRLLVSNFMGLQFAEHMDYLLRYPHGCSEQITSQLFPQLYFPEMARMISPQLLEAKEGASKQDQSIENIRKGILELESRAEYRGGTSTWSNNSAVNWWTSAYVTHFLVEARKKGYPVKERILDQHLEYLKDQCGENFSEEYRYWDENGMQTEYRICKEGLYSLYVLALAGKPELSIMNRYKSEPEYMSWDRNIILAATYALTGDLATFNALMPSQLSQERPARMSGGNFDSEVRTTAFVLFALLETDPDHPSVEPALQRLFEKSKDIVSTQDRAWAFMALGKASAYKSGLGLEVDAVVDGKIVGRFRGKNLEVISKDWLGKQLVLKARGKGEAHYSWQLRGIPTRPDLISESVQKGMALERKLLDRDGHEIIQPVFQQGEAVIVQLDIYAEKDLENIALIDMVPAGFEIVNDRLERGIPDWMDKTRSTSQFIDLRDDRAILYFDLAQGERKTFYYRLRTVGMGTYTHPPAAAEAMYNPDYRAQAPGQRVKVYDRTTKLPFRLVASLHPDCVDPIEDKFRDLWSRIQGDDSRLVLLRKNLLNSPVQP